MFKQKTRLLCFAHFLPHFSAASAHWYTDAENSPIRAFIKIPVENFSSFSSTTQSHCGNKVFDHFFGMKKFTFLIINFKTVFSFKTEHFLDQF